MIRKLLRYLLMPLGIAVCVALIATPFAHADPNTDARQPVMGNAPADGDIMNIKNDDDGTIDPQECGLDGPFGTAVCDLSMLLARIADESFHMLSMFMHVPPFETTQGASDTADQTQGGQASVTYTVWSLFRGIANAIFVIIFLIVIYSYITGVGVSTYNIKRMMPRLVVGVLLVNLSFYISAIAVDLANILGSGVVTIMKIATDAAISEALSDSGVPAPASIFQQVAGTAVFISAGAAGGALLIKYASISMFLPMITAAVFAIVSTVLVLLLRQTLAIVFVILSPLAFAAMILPSTSSYFNKWMKVFGSTLIIYPAVSLLYGAGYLAGKVINFVAARGDTAVAASASDILLQIMGIGVQVLPLMFIPAVMKLGGGLLNRIGSITNTPRARANKWAENKADVLRKRGQTRTLDKELSGNAPKSGIRRARHNGRLEGLKREARDKQYQDARGAVGASAVRSQLAEDSWEGRRFRAQMAGSNDITEQSRAKNAVLHDKMKANVQMVRARLAQFEHEHTPRNDVLKIATASAQAREDGIVTELEQEAAILKLTEAGDLGAILDIVKQSGNLTLQQRQTLVETINRTGVSKSAPFLANPQAQDAIMSGAITGDASFMSNVVAPSMQQDDYSASTYAAMDQDAAKAITETINAGAVDGATRVVHQDAAKQALSTKETANKITKQRRWVEQIAGPPSTGARS